jgi:hypothetical protein
MSYSNNISKLLNIEEPKDTIDYSKTITKEFRSLRFIIRYNNNNKNRN